MFAVLKSNRITVTGEIDALRVLQARNTFNLRFKTDVARAKGVVALGAVEGLTVTQYERTVMVTVLHVNLEVPQGRVAEVLGRYGTVLDERMSTYAEYPTVLTGIRLFRVELKEDIPSFVFIGGLKAHIRYLGQPRTCFRCGEGGHEARVCPNKRCARCFRVGHEAASCSNKVVCTLCGKEGHVLRACPSSYSAKAGGNDGGGTLATQVDEVDGDLAEGVNGAQTPIAPLQSVLFT